MGWVFTIIFFLLLLAASGYYLFKTKLYVEHIAAIESKLNEIRQQSASLAAEKDKFIETLNATIVESENKIASLESGANSLKTTNVALLDENNNLKKELVKAEKDLASEVKNREKLAKKLGEEMTKEAREKLLLKTEELSIKEKRADEKIKEADEKSKKLEQSYNERKEELEKNIAQQEKEIKEQLEETVKGIDDALGKKIEEIALTNTLAFTCSCSPDLIPCSIDFTKENTFRCKKCGSVYRVDMRAEPVFIERTASDADYAELVKRRLENHAENAL